MFKTYTLKSSNSTNNYNITSKIICFFLQFRNDIKMYHWQTKSFPYHKISDELLSTIDSLSDKFVETLLGRLETRPNIDSKIYIRNISDELFKEILDAANDFLVNQLSEIESYTDLINIRDEIIGEINKTKYLLTFS